MNERNFCVDELIKQIFVVNEMTSCIGTLETMSQFNLLKVRVNYTYVQQKINNFLIAFLQDVLTSLFLIKGFKMFNRPEHGKTHLS